MLRLLSRVFRTTAWHSLIIPTVAFVIGELVIVLAHHHQLTLDWVIKEFLPRFALVCVAFLYTASHFLAKEGATHLIDIQSLDRHLRAADGCIGISATSPQEWFDPATQVYLARLTRERFQRRAFFNERVLVFLTEGEYTDHTTGQGRTYDYAKSIALYHAFLAVPLYYVRPGDVSTVLKSLAKEEKAAIGFAGATFDATALQTQRLKTLLRYALLKVRPMNRILGFDYTGGHLRVSHVSDQKRALALETIADRLLALAKERDQNFTALILGRDDTVITPDVSYAALLGTWNTYHITREDGRPILRHESWEISLTPGGTPRLVSSEDPTHPDLRYEADIVEERGWLVFNFRGAGETWQARFTKPFSNRTVMVGIFVSLDFDNETFASLKLASRATLNEDEARTKIASAGRFLPDEVAIRIRDSL